MDLVFEQRDRIAELAAQVADLHAVIEADRTKIIEGVVGVEKVVNSKFWLTEGRGSYEWNDDRYREEFGDAIRSILKALEPMRKLGADLTNCPKTTAEVIEARRDDKRTIADLQGKLALAVEAMKAAEVFVDYIYQMIPLNSEKTAECNAVAAQLDITLTALAPTVAAHEARLKRQGAAEALMNEVKSLRDGMEMCPAPQEREEWRGNYADTLERRAAELRRQDD